MLIRVGLCVLMLGAAASALAAVDSFPFDRELLLETEPMRGSKRVPSLEVAETGNAAVDLWCASGPAQVTVAGETITVVPGALSPRACGPEQMRRDEELLLALTQTTNWRREGDSVVLLGPQTLRFFLATH
jgi:heat shock protein HslJ